MCLKSAADQAVIFEGIGIYCFLSRKEKQQLVQGKLRRNQILVGIGCCKNCQCLELSSFLLSKKAIDNNNLIEVLRCLFMECFCIRFKKITDLCLVTASFLLLIVGCFSSKTRTSLKTQLLFHVLEHSNFPAFSLPESYSQTNKFPKNCLHSRISIICECVHIAFCFPSRRPILTVRP